MYDLRWIAFVSLLSACAGRAPAPTPPPITSAPRVQSFAPVHKRGAQKLIVEVGSAGGTLELDNGARLVIPAGALEEPVEVTFAEGARTTAFANRDFERAVGPTLEIAPALALSAPLRVSVRLGQLPEGFSEGDLAMAVERVSTTQRAVVGHAMQTRWDYVSASTEHGRALAELSRPPGLRLQFVVSKSE